MESKKLIGHKVDIGLRVYTNGVDTVVAYSPDDALKCMCEQTGESIEAYLQYAEEFYLNECKGLSIYLAENNSAKTTKTLQEWVEWNGRGFLCSTEW